MSTPVTWVLIFGVVQVVTVAGGAIWVVASIRGKTDVLAQSNHHLASAIDKLDGTVDRLQSCLRDHDRRITRLEVIQEGYRKVKQPGPVSD